MDDFDRADIDDHLLDLADDRELQRLDWLELHGYDLVHPTLAEACQQVGFDKRRAAHGTDLIIEEEMTDG
jgi:hypothetical protein